MAINFPTSLDSLTNPTSENTLDSPSHSTQHANANDALEALEAKVGANGSAVTTSHDYKLSGVTGSDKSVSLTGAETLTNKTLTSPKVGTDILDTNGNELLKVTATGSAVNELTLANAATGNDVNLSATGGDTDIGLYISGKGAGKVYPNSPLAGLEVFKYLPGLRVFIPMSAQSAGTAGSASGAGTVYDQSGCAKNATLAGNPIFSGGLASGTAESATDIFAPSVIFDGTDDYMRIATDAHFNITGAMSVGMWARAFGANGGQRIAGSSGEAANTNKWLIDGRSTYGLSVDNNGNWSTTYDNGGMSSNFPETWTFHSWTYIPSTSILYYRNGALDTNYTSTVIASMKSVNAQIFLGGFAATAAATTISGGECTTGAAISCFFLCAGALNAKTHEHLYKATRGAFGV